MKLELRVVPGNDAEELLAADPEIGGRFEVRRPFWVEAASPDFERMVGLTRRSDGLWVTPQLTFTPQEAAQAPFAQLVARKTLAVSDRDSALNEEHSESRPLRGKVMGGVRLMERFVASKGKLPARALLGVGEAGEEYAAGVEAAEVLRGAKVRGLELRPLRTSKGTEREDGFHLFTEQLAPPALLEEGVVSKRGSPAQDPEAQLLGCLVYAPAAIERMPDACRTAEPFAAWKHPVWIFSRRLVERVRAEKVTGVSFLPVLVAGSPLHQEYVRQWRELVRLMALGPRNSF